MSIEHVVLIVFALSFVGLGYAAMRRSKQRKAESFAAMDGPNAEVASEPTAAPLESLLEEETTSPSDADESVDRNAPAEDVVPRDAPVVEDQQIKAGLEKTRSSFLGRLKNIFMGQGSVDDSVMDALEDILLTADVGVKLAMELVEKLREDVKQGKLEGAESLRAALKEYLREALGESEDIERVLVPVANGPKVILFVGVNGAGKTTSIGKIASLLRSRGNSVVLAAGDTFRAAATEQLEVWGERTDCRVVKGQEGSDPASVVFNAVQHGMEAGVDFVLADTAGRLHTKIELMDEIKKVGRAAGKTVEGAPHEIWLVVDGTTGQNAMLQAKEFNEVLGLTGVVLTKLDGTAKGGVVIGISNSLSVPIRFVGVGEKAEDLRPFDARSFINGLFDDGAA